MSIEDQLLTHQLDLRDVISVRVIDQDTRIRLGANRATLVVASTKGNRLFEGISIHEFFHEGFFDFTGKKQSCSNLALYHGFFEPHPADHWRFSSTTKSGELAFPLTFGFCSIKGNDLPIGPFSIQTLSGISLEDLEVRLRPERPEFVPERNPRLAHGYFLKNANRSTRWDLIWGTKFPGPA